MFRYKEGDKVKYTPVGGPESRTSRSVGVVRDCMGGRNSIDDEPRYKVENIHTHKASSVKEGNIEGPAE
ncbi:hypothetical protein E8E15_007539 [Penicillium rubens]|uniref:Pc18g00290 protein n=2 Tax=Penicillium chrysogenum species complex TaxID=254878 RepID=B6HBP4_PENRW|nr:uncharacterized protein N7525_000940 [Penicillium rubens]KAJ5276696.1 hypothetical protein N7524_002849 [Penicillium chrysogenum]CAP94253.1 Pc18g00290 [Penicillium rubens Wisconsin 54-1255]KAF3022802.1 hypothetical protein E8E15_007539 [Penicillium rubens]KAJ5039354.1 hypothetical protein NUH16_009136 [Penicillium rubens]KAJ5843199.1 hypothetical protein N7525_000940 [Penicillium rubens]